MKGILTKLGEEYKLYSHDSCIATTHKSPHKKLSKQNCDDIFEYIQQPKEVEVSVEMEKVVDETKMIGVVKGVKGSGNKITTYKSVPKLDENGYLTLIRII
jgi:hypothetical protein